MLEIQDVTPAQLMQVYYWDEANPVSRFLPFTPEQYLAKVTAANWVHYGIYRNGVFVACLSVEAWAADRWEIHVTTARRAIKPSELRRAVIAIKNGALRSGVKEVFAFVPNLHKAAQRLCRDCGLSLVEEISTELVINETPVSYLKFSYVEAEATNRSDAFPAN